MLKRFRIIVLVLVSTASIWGAVAQAEGYKAVILNGKPSRLDIKTGVITTADSKSLPHNDVSKTVDSIKPVSTPAIIEIVAVRSNDKTSKQKGNVHRIQTGPTENIESLDDNEIRKSGSATFHTVEEGETLYGLSKKYQTSLGALQKANHLETTLITVGQILKVTHLSVIENASKSIWIVETGDTLYGIAKKNSTTVKRLKRLNQLQDNTIRVGQELQIR
jgi:LysM repeat protein